MKKYSYIVEKQFQVNKRKNFFTLMGIVLGIVLFTTVNYLNYFMRDLNIEQAKYLNGDYHAVIKDLSDEQMTYLRYNPKVEICGFYSLDHSSKIEIKEQLKDLYIYGLDETSINSLFNQAMDLVEGRFPNKAGELTLSFEGKNELNLVVGQEIQVENDKYTIVGFFKGRNEHPSVIQGVTVLNKESFEHEINGAISVKEKKHIYAEIKEVVKDLGISNKSEDDIRYNNNLLYAYGDYSFEKNGIVNDQSITLVLTNIAILVLTIILTYGSINVSMKERIQQFSLLRCIGASSDKIRWLLIKEGIILGVLAIIPGIFIGHLVIVFIIKFVFQEVIRMNLYGITLIIYWKVILKAIILTFIIIFSSAIIPVIQAGKISPLGGIINGGSSIKKVKKRNSKIIRRIFGYEGEIAYKNIRGNNKNFLLTTIILSSLLVVFVAFTGVYNVFKGETFSKIERNSENVKIEYYTLMNDGVNNNGNKIPKSDLELSESYKKELENTGIVENIKSGIVISDSLLFEDLKSNRILENEKRFNFKGKDYTYSRHGTINIYDDDLLKEIYPHIKGEDLTIEEFEENGIIIINPLVKVKGFKKEVKEVFESEYNKDITFYIEKINGASLYENPTIDGLTNTLKDSFKVEGRLLGTIDYSNIIDKRAYVNPWGLNIIVSDDFYVKNKEIFNGEEFNGGNAFLNFSYKEGQKNEENISIIKKLANEFGGWYYDYEKDFCEDARKLNGMAIIVYTILFVAMAIGILNILNNKIINMQLRNKEFGTLLAMGMSKKKLKRVIVMEGVLQWTFSSLIGGVISYITLKVIYLIYAYTGNLSFIRLPIWSIITGISILLLINIISSLIPLRKINTLEVTELIRENE